MEPPTDGPEASTGPFALKINIPQAVTLADFSAVQQGDSVLLTWETNSELDNRGFNLYRGTSAAGPDRQLNETLIPSQSQGNPGGFVYTWEDRADLVPGTTYFYWVEDVDIYGVATMHGPVSVDYTVPTAVTAEQHAAPARRLVSAALAMGRAGAGMALGLSRIKRRAERQSWPVFRSLTRVEESENNDDFLEHARLGGFAIQTLDDTMSSSKKWS